MTQKTDKKPYSNMALEFSDVVIKIKKTLDKYKGSISIGNYLTLKEDLDDLEETFNSTVDVMREKNERVKGLERINENLQNAISGYQRRIHKMNIMTFAERLKFLFKKYQ